MGQHPKAEADTVVAVHLDEFLESVRDRQAWIDLVWVIALMGVGVLIAVGLDAFDAPSNYLTTTLCFSPLGIFAFVRSRQRS